MKNLTALLVWFGPPANHYKLKPTLSVDVYLGGD